MLHPGDAGRVLYPGDAGRKSYHTQGCRKEELSHPGRLEHGGVTPREARAWRSNTQGMLEGYIHTQGCWKGIYTPREARETYTTLRG